MGFLSTIGRIATTVLPKIAIPVAGAVLAGKVGSAAIDIFKQIAGGILNKSGDGQGLFSSSIPVNIPNPLSSLNGLLSGVGGAFNSGGDFLNRVGDFLTGNRNIPGYGDVTVPRFTDRAPQVAQYSSALAGQVAGGAYDSAVNPALVGVGRGGAGPQSPLYGGLSPTQNEMLQSIEDPAARARMAIQFKLQNQVEISQFVSNVMKLLHDMNMAVIRNIQA